MQCLPGSGVLVTVDDGSADVVSAVRGLGDAGWAVVVGCSTGLVLAAQINVASIVLVCVCVCVCWFVNSISKQSQRLQQPFRLSNVV